MEGDNEEVELNDDHQDGETAAALAPHQVTRVPWLRQLRCVLRKNVLLLSRRPIQLLLMVLSSIGSVLLAYGSIQRHAKLSSVDFATVPLTKCGTVDPSFYYDLDWNEVNDIPVSHNEPWRGGMGMILMAMGPMFHAVFVFLLVQVDIQTQMLGILRGLGLRDSVFWASWWIPFLGTSFLNSLGGAITAAALSNHAFQHIYFMGILGSFFFLNLALVGASFFVAAFCGTTRGGAATWCIILILVAQWPVGMVQLFQSEWVESPSSVEWLTGSPAGLFWLNRETAQVDRGSSVWIDNGDFNDFFNETIVPTTATPTLEYCDVPLVSKARGGMFGLPEDQLDFPDDEFFVGCYFTAGYVSSAWNQDKKIGLAVLFMFPYFHFSNIWAAFLGYTSMPDKTFTARHASMTPEELAIESLPTPLDQDYGRDSKLWSQGVTLNTERKYYPYYSYPDNRIRSNCPAPELHPDYFCSSQGSSCTSATEVSPTKSPSVGEQFGILFFLAVLYTLMAAYWTQVFPRKNGAPRKFYYFLLPSYWFGSRLEQSQASVDRVEVQDAQKNYGGFEALKGVSMTMASGEVTALLGHNGAGKTTLSHIISCEIGASGGDVSVFGHSVVNDPDAVRGLVAVCKQDDYLYPDLSAKEHLFLFGGLRGVSSEDLPEIVQKWLESVDLSIVQNQFSTAFSGGMKRRLSLALSTIGGRPVIILDEPTTGMDPLSRRFVWKHIDEIKEGRVVLLTTHAMEEADLLADSVAIMRKGELAAFGTPLELKSEYGSALQFSLLVESESVGQAEKDIKRHFKGHPTYTDVVAGEAGNITVKISAIKQSEEDEGVDVTVLTDFVAWLEDKTVSGVTEYGFSNSSLEEVFLKVTQAEDEERENRDELDEFDVCCAGCSKCCILCCLRSCCRCCCCPKPNSVENEVDEEVVAGGFDSNKVATFTPVLSTWSQIVGILYFTISRHWVGKWGTWVFYAILIGATLLFSVRATNSFSPIALLTGPVVLMSMAIVTFISPIYRDRDLGVLHLMRSQGLLRSSFVLGSGLYSFVIQFLLTFFTLSLVYATGLYQPPDFCGIGDLDDFCPSKAWSWTRTVSPEIVWRDPEYGSRGASVYATWQGGGYWKMVISALAFALTTPGAVFSSSYLPGFKLALVTVVTVSILASVIPLIGYFILAPRRFNTEECIRDICPVNTNPNDFSLSDLKTSGSVFLNCVGLFVSGGESNLCLPSRAAILPQFGLFQMMALTLFGDIAFVSEPAEYAEDVFVPALGGGVRCSGSVCQFPTAQDRFLSNFGFMILGALILLVLGFCLVSFFSFPSGITLGIRHFVAQIWKIVTCEGRREEKLAKTHKTESKPFEEVISESELVRAIVCKKLTGDKKQNVDEEMGSPTSPGSPDGQPASQMMINMSTVARDELPPVLAHTLRKVYPSLGGVSPKVALASLDLHVPKGQVLGLLGQNGAGKTTAIKIWAGAHEATSGLALVAGYDVSSEMLSVFERLGNCPQFDVVCPSETVQRHLEFFALLKGLPMSKVRPIALSIATAVGLGAQDVYHRHASRLSGGMRRRLSIAISLIGAPSVLLLDEPTTGLDPSTRNSIWNLVNSFATKERAIIITTHMMLEADTLCNRIAIMAHGKLKAVGTQQALKDRFGSGYLLQLNLIRSTPENQDVALSFVRKKIHKDAVLQNRQAKTLRVALPRDVNLAEVFRVLYSKEIASEGCVNQFLLSQSSLEDVFIALGD